MTPWQLRALEHAKSTLAEGRMGHATLICGPAGVGKRVVANALARQLLVHSERDTALLDAGTHPDLHVVTFQENREGKLRKEIVVEQVRGLGEWLALTPQYGHAQVAIVDPADAVNISAWNALLKTLEEPQPGRYLLLLASIPARLPATIRSRCQQLWVSREAVDESTESLVVHGQVAQDLGGIVRGELSALEVALRWAGDEHTALRLRHAATLTLERAQRNSDNPERVLALAAWFDQVNRTRDLLRGPVRADAALVDLLTQLPRA